ncbi:MAG TPA: PIG-L family deacetylase [Verrucomicrobiae bacterium]|nr:PIG-L family deacetylase [Verrucomicrobiae bacterium]
MWVCVATVIIGLPDAGFSEPPSPEAILQDLHKFEQMGSVLYIAAHPDDENTQLIAYLARGRLYRTAYLSLTRGDGGQNVLGPEFGDELGVIRTQELLAARRLDGGRQFFTRAVDFGFSKDYRETLRIWDRQEVLSDIVRVIRTFQPDVLITRFSTHPGGTHGHHTASAVLALEAFKLAGDPKAFPDQLQQLAPWQPKRILWNGFFRGASTETNGVLRIEVGGEDPVLHESFADIAGRSRSMHKTQGFGNYSGRGGGGMRTESFQLLAGETATQDILDGVDTTWSRVPGGAEIGRLAEEVTSHFDTKNPAASVPALLTIRARVAALPHNPLLDDKRHQLDGILQNCLGLSVETIVSRAEVVPGETMKLRHTITVRPGMSVRWVETRYPVNHTQLKAGIDLSSEPTATRETTQILSTNTPLSQPYWLRHEHSPGMFRVDDPSLIGRPENTPAFPIEHVFEIGGQSLVVADEPVQIITDAKKGQFRRRLEVIAPVSLQFASDVKLFSPRSSRSIEVEITAARPDSAGALRLDAPGGWKVEPATRSFHLANAGDHTRLEFTVAAPPEPATGLISALADVNGATWSSERVDIRYAHIPWILLQPPAHFKAVGVQLAIEGGQVGYVPGAGDSVAEGLEQMGYTVTRLNGADFTPERLRSFDAVIFGVRAFNVRTDLSPVMPALFKYIQDGGNVIVQYNRPEGLKTTPISPYELRISGERVTDEEAPVTFLTPEHPALNVPNKISSADFVGWVQERGLYFPSQWDEHFTPILACNDPGEAPLKGGLLVAHYGRGYFVYTGLAWFRQLPAGVPGAYRLFANLVSLGKTNARAEAGGLK